MRCPRCRSEVGSQPTCPYCGSIINTQPVWDSYRTYEMPTAGGGRPKTGSSDMDRLRQKISRLEMHSRQMMALLGGLFALQILTLLVILLK